MPWPCKWEQIGCRLAKWSPRPKCSPALDRAEGFDLRRCGRAVPTWLVLAVALGPLTTAKGVLLYRRMALGSAVLTSVWIPGVETRIPSANL